MTPKSIGPVFQRWLVASRGSLVIPLAAAAGGFSCVEMAKAAPIEVPTIDKLSVRVLVDGGSDIFFRPQEVSGVRTEPGRSANSLRPLHSEWGLSLLLEPQRGDESDQSDQPE